MSATFQITANVVDVRNRRIAPATVSVVEGRITAIEPSAELAATYLVPGFVDSHVHIESSMLTPAEFARAAVVHGTLASVSDPHEIGNVLGVAGVQYMLDNAEGVPFRFNFGAPSCVPATTFETAGAEITVEEIAQLLDDPRIGYLSEMMNFPGVLHADPQVMAKLQAAKTRNKPIDGHAPGLRGEQAQAYISAGITTDHECFTKEEALDKLQFGAKILIREGSAARNFDALYSLMAEYPDRCMLCSDDKHPDELLAGHINVLVRRAVERGIDVFDALQAACLNPVEHYRLGLGLLQVGDRADFVELDNLQNFDVLRAWYAGQLVAEAGTTTIPRREPQVVNQFAASPRRPDEFAIETNSPSMNVIEAIDGQLITRRLQLPSKIVDGRAVADPSRDLLKLAVVNRYQDAPPAIAFIKNFGLQGGAMASSVAHDSHNIVAVGASDEELCRAINLVIAARGGLSVVGLGQEQVLPLPVAGLMATGTCAEVGHAYEKLDKLTKQLGSPLRAPFMTLSFMALLVIPDIKLSDRGLFDGQQFEFLPLFGS